LFFSLSSLLLVICEEREKRREREREKEISYRHNEAPIIKSPVLLEIFGRNEFNDSKKGY
jgi:hypothetical protein